jgi:PAS domain S-box-containing protein
MKKQQVKPTIASIAQGQERFALLVRSIKEYAMFILDPKGRVTDWNIGAEHLLGYTEKAIIGKNFSIFFTREDRKLGKPQIELQTALEIGRAEDDNWLVRKNKSRFWASGLSVPLRDRLGNLLGFAKIVRDLTDQKHLEQQRDDFIGMASHELKTPLTSLRGFTQLLEKHLKKNGAGADSKALFYIEKIMEQIGKQESLLKDFMDVAQLEGTGLSGEGKVVEIDKLVSKIVQDLQATTPTHKLVIKGNTGKKIVGNEQHTGQVILNLLTNAIKYSPAAKKVMIRLSSTLSEVRVSVQDYGIGIPKHQQKRIFDRFYRADNIDAENMTGYGLGLYIASEIVKQHRGKIGVRSTPKTGTTFYFTLPCVDEAQENSPLP